MCYPAAMPLDRPGGLDDRPCAHRQGPYKFSVATGASTVTVTRELARRLYESAAPGDRESGGQLRGRLSRSGPVIIDRTLGPGTDRQARKGRRCLFLCAILLKRERLVFALPYCYDGKILGVTFGVTGKYKKIYIN